MYIKNDLSSHDGLGVYFKLSNGLRGVDETLKILTKITLDSLRDPIVKLTAVQITPKSMVNNNYYIKQVYDFVRSKMKYVPDTSRIEEVTAPNVHLKRIMSNGYSYGDCDDFSALGAALLMSLGVPTQFRVVGTPKNRGTFDHIRAEGLSSKGWIPLETTMRNVAYGENPKYLTSKVYPIF